MARFEVEDSGLVKHFLEDDQMIRKDKIIKKKLTLLELADCCLGNHRLRWQARNSRQGSQINWNQ